MATKKKFKKMLKQLVDTMPVVTKLVHEDHIVKGDELIAQGHFEIKSGLRVDPDKTYKQPMPVIMARNHEKRLKKIYKKHGRDGISSYVNEIKSIAAANN